MEDSDRVVISVPARGEFARTLRVAGAELAARANLRIDEIEDMRLAVEEAFVFACDRAGSGSVTFAFGVSPGSVELMVGPMPGNCGEGGDGAEERYSRFILEHVCDEYEMLERQDGCYVRLVKRTE